MNETLRTLVGAGIAVVSTMNPALAQETTTQRAQLSEVVASFGLDEQERAAIAGQTCDRVDQYPDGVVCTVDQSFSVDPAYAKYDRKRMRNPKKDKGEYMDVGERSHTTGDQVVLTGISAEC